MSNEIFDGHLQFHFTTVDLVAMVLDGSALGKKELFTGFEKLIKKARLPQKPLVESESIRKVRQLILLSLSHRASNCLIFSGSHSTPVSADFYSMTSADSINSMIEAPQEKIKLPSSD